MLRKIINNIRYDITGNYSYIKENAGNVKALAYLSRKGYQLCKAVILNKTRKFQEIDFYDTWE